MNKDKDYKNCRISLFFDDDPLPKPKLFLPTREEIENSLPGFKDQHVPKIMTLEILEEVFPYVQEFRSDND